MTIAIAIFGFLSIMSILIAGIMAAVGSNAAIVMILNKAEALGVPLSRADVVRGGLKTIKSRAFSDGGIPKKILDAFDESELTTLEGHLKRRERGLVAFFCLIVATILLVVLSGVVAFAIGVVKVSSNS